MLICWLKYKKWKIWILFQLTVYSFAQFAMHYPRRKTHRRCLILLAVVQVSCIQWALENRCHESRLFRNSNNYLKCYFSCTCAFKPVQVRHQNFWYIVLKLWNKYWVEFDIRHGLKCSEPYSFLYKWSLLPEC